MRECKRHPSESQPGGGVCARCLEERLSWLWRGESFRHADMARPSTSSTTSRIPTSSTLPTTTSSSSLRGEDYSSQSKLHQPKHPGAFASRRAFPELDGLSGPVTSTDGGVLARDGEPRVTHLAMDETPDSKAVIEEWAAFHARRRGTAVEPDLEMESPTTKSSKSFDSMESLAESGARPAHPNPDLLILMNAQKMRTQSIPLDFRSAEDTAARVINELPESYLEEDFGIYEVREGGETSLQEQEAQRCFSPVWHSPKWVKVLASPMNSRNRVFPSRAKDADVRRRARSKRGVRFDSSDWGFKESSGKPRSVFSWLQDAETIQFKHDDPAEHLTSSSSSSLTNSVSTDSWLRDLTTVGHLHEIAEELEIVEESSEGEAEEEEGIQERREEGEHLGEVSSFGKFLLQAAQRRPDARLTRLVSAPASSQGL